MDTPSISKMSEMFWYGIDDLINIVHIYLPDKTYNMGIIVSQWGWMNNAIITEYGSNVKIKSQVDDIAVAHLANYNIHFIIHYLLERLFY